MYMYTYYFSAYEFNDTLSFVELCKSHYPSKTYFVDIHNV